MTHKLDGLVVGALTANLRGAAAILRAEGWAPSTAVEVAGGGVTVAHALKRASQVGPEVHASRAILRSRGVGEKWWKSPERSAVEVIDALMTVTPTVAEIELLGGPRWRPALFILIMETALAAPVVGWMDEARGDGWVAACTEARSVAATAGLASRLGDGLDFSPWCAIRGAAWATALTPWMGEGGLSYEVYATLMTPLRVVGVPHFQIELDAHDDDDVFSRSGIARVVYSGCEVEARELGIVQQGAGHG